MTPCALSAPGPRPVDLTDPRLVAAVTSAARAWGQVLTALDPAALTGRDTYDALSRADHALSTLVWAIERHLPAGTASGRVADRLDVWIRHLHEADVETLAAGAPCERLLALHASVADLAGQPRLHRPQPT